MDLGLAVVVCLLAHGGPPDVVPGGQADRLTGDP